MAGPMRKKLLQSLIAKIEAAQKPVAIFDLDGTVFDVVYRTMEILKRFLAQTEIRSRFPEQVATCEKIRHQDHHYTLQATLAAVGLDPYLENNAQFMHLAENFWFRHFFKDELLLFDVAYPGAQACVTDFHKRGVHIVYLSGRDIPNMSKGTIESLEKGGFPCHGHNVTLFLKPAFGQDDLLFKKQAIETIKQTGEIIATFDNEPANVEMFLKAFPKALHFHHNTHFARAVELKGENLHVVKDFVEMGY